MRIILLVSQYIYKINIKLIVHIYSCYINVHIDYEFTDTLDIILF